VWCVLIKCFCLSENACPHTRVKHRKVVQSRGVDVDFGNQWNAATCLSGNGNLASILMSYLPSFLHCTDKLDVLLLHYLK